MMPPLPPHGESSGRAQTKEALDFFRHEYSMNFQMATMKTPLFCIMDGMTLGGGVGISLYARFRIATENTVSARARGWCSLLSLQRIQLVRAS